MMNNPDLTTIEADEVFDVRGETCPFPALHTQKKLKKLPVGQVLEIIIDHPPSAEETVPGICARYSWPYVSIREKDFWRIKVLKSQK